MGKRSKRSRKPGSQEKPVAADADRAQHKEAGASPEVPAKRGAKAGRIKRGRVAYVILGLILMIGGTVVYAKYRQGGANTAVELAQIQAEHRIIDVHEHIQSLKQAATMLAAMDKLGIGKVCLMGSSWFTITLNPTVGFTRYDENNEELLKIRAQYPGRFEAWPTMDPRDPQKLEKFQNLIERGAEGLKLYLGHGFVIKKTAQYMFHTMALDDPRMAPVYRYCQENFIPVVLHVQPDKKLGPGFLEEFVAVLTEFPDMKVVCPHYMLSSKSPTRLAELLDSFPNLYSDVSFGHDDYLVPGLRRISEAPAKLLKVFETYPDRFMFSTDIVLTEEPVKTEQWVYDRFKAYIDMLTQDTYTTPVVPGEPLRGLALRAGLLERVFYKNYEAFMALKPAGTKPKRVNWRKLGVSPSNRKPGETLPPSVL